MKQAIVTIQGESPYSQSKHYEEPKKPRETHAEYEERTWRERTHADASGRLFIPPMAFSNCWKAAAKRLGIKIPGAGNKTYTAAFEAGLLVIEPVPLDVTKDDVQCDRLFVPSDGIKGSGKRVIKYFPRVDVWGGVVTFHILDDVINEEIFTRVSEHAGLLTGIGRFRPERGGFYGRFRVASIDWRDDT